MVVSKLVVVGNVSAVTIVIFSVVVAFVKKSSEIRLSE